MEPCPVLGHQEPLLRKHMPELDAARGMAILAVVLYHGIFWNTDLQQLSRVQKIFVMAMWPGRMGVNLFFVLSGFLITGILIDSLHRTDYYERFYIRRALRILPAYYALLILLLCTRLAEWHFIALSAVYLSNLTPLFGVAMAYPVLWSLAVEEHFYLLWPAIVRHVSLRNLATILIAIVVVTPVARLVSFFSYRHNGFVDYVFTLFTWNAADGLACGALLAILLRSVCLSFATFSKIAASSMAVGILTLLCGLPFGIWTSQRAVGAALLATAFNIFFFGLLLEFLVLGARGSRPVIANRYLRFLGDISYGLYLNHLLIFGAYDRLAASYRLAAGWSDGFAALLIRFVVAGLISVGVAYLSKRWFENQFLKLKVRWT